LPNPTGSRWPAADFTNTSRWDDDAAFGKGVIADGVAAGTVLTVADAFGLVKGF